MRSNLKLTSVIKKSDLKEFAILESYLEAIEMNPYTTAIEEIKSLVPVYKDILNPGVSGEEMDAFLKNIHLEIPAAFIEFHKACDGGQPYEATDLEGITFLSLQRVAKDKIMFDEIQEEKRQAGEFFYWHKDWLPFADDFSYDTLCIDTSGAATGMKGCILQRSKDLFEEDEMSIFAPDFATYVKDWMERVKKGQVYSLKETDEDGKNIPVEDGGHYFKFIAKVPFKA